LYAWSALNTIEEKLIDDPLMIELFELYLLKIFVTALCPYLNVAVANSLNNEGLTF